MPVTLDNKLVVALSSRALFDFEEENRVLRKWTTGLTCGCSRTDWTKTAPPSVAFPLAKKLLAFNADGVHRRNRILSRNDPVSGLRVFFGCEEAGLDLGRHDLHSGAGSLPLLDPLGAHLFLSANADDVRKALTGFSRCPGFCAFACRYRASCRRVADCLRRRCRPVFRRSRAHLPAGWTRPLSCPRTNASPLRRSPPGRSSLAEHTEACW